MLSETRKNIILSSIKNDMDYGASMEDTFSLEEMLFYVRTLQAMSVRVSKETIQKTVKLMRRYSPWYMLTLNGSEVPYIENNKGFLFSDIGLSTQAKKIYASTGQILSITKMESYDESPFDLFARYGVQVVSINKGTSGIALKTSVLSPVITENVHLNNAMLRFAVASSIGSDDMERLDREVSEEIMHSELYFIPEGDLLSPIQEILEFTDGGSAIGGYLFTNRQEVSLVYLDTISNVKKAPVRKIIGTDPLVGKYVLNPGSVNLIISQELVDALKNS